MKEKPYHKLLVWQRAHEFVKDVYGVTKKFPKEEQFGIVSQLQRAAVSVAANIVEGQAKHSQRDFKRFLWIARGSLAECEYFLELSRDLGFISEKEYCEIDEERGEVSFLLNKFMKSVI